MEEKNTNPGQDQGQMKQPDVSTNPGDENNPTASGDMSTAPYTSAAPVTAPEAAPDTEANTPGANTPESTDAASSTPWTFIAAVVVVIALLAGGVWWLSQNDSNTDLGTPAAGTAAPSFSASDYPDVVAVVNGVEVSSERFIEGLEQAAQQVAQQGANPNDEATRAQMEEQTATALVNTELLKQAAASAGVSADEAAIDAEIDAIIAQFGSEEVFDEELAAAGLTLEQLRSDFREQLTIDAYIRQTAEWSSVDIEAGEAQAFYDDIAAQNEGQELPPFAEVEAAIEEQLLGTKQQEITQELIERLRSEAEIEVLI